MELKDGEVVPAERLGQIKGEVEKAAQERIENPNYIEATKLALLVLVDAVISRVGEGLPSWTLEWNLGHKPRRFFAIAKHPSGQILVHLERPERKWVELENIEVEQCWEINKVLNDARTPHIRLLE